MKILKYILILSLLFQPFIVAFGGNNIQAATVEVFDHYELGNYSGTFVDVNKQRNWVLTQSGSTYYIYNFSNGTLVTSFVADGGILSKSFRDDIDAMGTNTRMYYRHGDTIYYRDKNNITTSGTSLLVLPNPTYIQTEIVISQDRIAFYNAFGTDQIYIYSSLDGSYIHSKTPNYNLTSISSFAIGRDGMVGVFGSYSGKTYAYWYGKDDLTPIVSKSSAQILYLQVKFLAASSYLYSSETEGSSTKELYVFRGTTQVFYISSTSSSFEHIEYNDESNTILVDNIWRPIVNIGSSVGAQPYAVDDSVQYVDEILDSSANLVTLLKEQEYWDGVSRQLPNSAVYKGITYFLEVAPKQGLLSSTDQNKVLIYLENGDIIYFKKSGSLLYMDKKVSMLNSNYILLEYDSTNNIIWTLDTYNMKLVKVVSSQVVTEGNITQIITDNSAIIDIQNDLENKLELSDTVGIAENLVPNGDFELGTKGWLVNNNAYSGIATTSIKSDAQSGQYVYTTTKRINFISEDYIPIDDTKKYKLEGYFRDIGTNTYGVYLGFVYYNGNKSQISYNYPAAANQNPTTAWTKYEGFIGGNSPLQFPSGTKFVRIYIWTNYSTSSSFTTEIDNIRLTTSGDLYSIDQEAYNQLQNVDTRVTELEKDTIAPIIYEVDTVVENKSAVDLSTEGSNILFLIQVQDDRAASNQMQYSYRRNDGTWSSWVSIPSNGQISVYVGNGANTYEFKVQDNASPANESLIYKFNRTIWGL